MVGEKFDSSEAHLCGKSCVNFHSVTVKCSVRLLAKFEFSIRASNKLRFNSCRT